MRPFESARKKQLFGAKVRIKFLTDQELDSSTGLYNYDARLYDPSIGMFISPDSVVQNWHDPQSLNRYSYCRNNPLKYTDPSGHIFLIDDIAIVVGAVAITNIAAMAVAWGGIQAASHGINVGTEVLGDGPAIGDATKFGNSLMSPVVEIDRLLIKTMIEPTIIDDVIDRAGWISGVALGGEGIDFLGGGYDKNGEFHLTGNLDSLGVTTNFLFDMQNTKFNKFAQMLMDEGLDSASKTSRGISSTYNTIEDLYSIYTNWVDFKNNFQNGFDTINNDKSFNFNKTADSNTTTDNQKELYWEQGQ